MGAILLRFALRLRLIRGSRLFWRWEWGAGSGVAGGEGRYARYGDCPFDGDFRPAYRFCCVIGCRINPWRTILLPVRWIRWQTPLLGGILCAICYARLTGLQPPALRTVAALSVWGGLKLSGRQWSGWQVWCCCLAAIIFADPVAVISQSLWLSAFAVAGLLFWYQWFPAPNGNFPRGLRWLLNLLHLQAGITLLLLPLGGAFSWHKRYRNAGESFAVPGHICDGSTHPAGMILHLTGPFFLKSGYGT